MKVLIIQSVAKQYRRPLFDLLYKDLKDHGVELIVAYGKPNPVDNSKNDNIELPGVYGIPVTTKYFLKNKLIYQNVFKLVNESDLVIVEQANKHLINYILFLLKILKLKKFAFWGHGYNHQSDKRLLLSKIKYFFLSAPNWWFAYTESVKSYLISEGIKETSITALNNSIDTNFFKNELQNAICRESLLNKYNLPTNSVIGLYCGSLYKEKLIPFLLESAIEIKKHVHSFKLFITGSGPDLYLVEEAASKHNWIIVTGNLFGQEKANIYKHVDVILNPGLVGLGILDAFSAGKVLATTNYRYHSPEISYATNGYNSVITPLNTLEYTKGVLNILNNDNLRYELERNSLESSHQYSIASMTSRFSDGIKKALSKS